MPPSCLFSDLCPPHPSLPCPPTLPILSLLLAHGSRGISRAGSSKQLLRQELPLKDFFLFLLPLKSSFYFALRATEQVTDKTSGLVLSRDWVLGRDTHCSRSSIRQAARPPSCGLHPRDGVGAALGRRPAALPRVPPRNPGAFQRGGQG